MTQEIYDAILAIQKEIRGVAAYQGLRFLRRHIRTLERQLAEKRVTVDDKET